MLVLARPPRRAGSRRRRSNRGLAAIVLADSRAPTSSTSRCTTPSSCSSARRAPRAAANGSTATATSSASSSRSRARHRPPSATSTSCSASSSRRAASSPAPTPAASTSSRATTRSRAAHAPLQALAERLGELRLARVHDPDQRAIDGRRTSRSTRSRSTSPTSTTCRRGSPFGFDRSFDEKIGYRTQSRCCATPLALARATRSSASFSSSTRSAIPREAALRHEDVDEQVIAFDERSEELLARSPRRPASRSRTRSSTTRSGASSRASSRASVEAIEQRDPTTSGHSRRVADLTVGLAQAVERVDTGPYREVVFTREDLRELEYASLLHDFGKIGVREEVLVKAKKLYPHRARDHPRSASTSRSARSRSTSCRASSRALEQGRAGASSRRSIDELATARGELDAALRTPSRAPTSRPCSKGGDFAAHRGDRARDLHATSTGERRSRCSRAREVASLSVDARLAHAGGDRRDPQPRLAHVQVPLADPLGQELPARRRSSPARTTSGSTAPATPTACAPRRSRCSRR